MRRFVVAALLPLAILSACSSSDDDSNGDPDGGLLLGGEAGSGGDGALADGNASSDAKTDGAAVGDAALGQDFSGEATYYDADGTGACGFKASPGDLNVTAMNKAQYKKAICGQCVLVTGPKGTVKVRIVDLCPGCAMGGLDLSKQAFSSIAALSAGRVKITWHFVTC